MNYNVENIIDLINNEYSNNGLTNTLIEKIKHFAVQIIKNNEVDIFWSDSARNFLVLLIISYLVNGNVITYKDLIEQVKDINEIKNIMFKNINKFSNIPEISEIISTASLLNSDKPLKSIVEIIEKSLSETNFAPKIKKTYRKMETKSIEEILNMVNLGNAEAINELAYRYFNGIGIEKNQKKAYELWCDSASFGNIDARYNVALCYLFGEGTLKNEEKALKIFENLEENNNHIKSILYLGEIYYFGLGQNIDYQKSMHYYNKVLKMDSNNLRAKFCIAYAYCSGKGVERNFEIAYKMFKDLVEKNNYEEAFFYLGEFYYLGRVVQQDYQKALLYFNKSLSFNKNIYATKYYLGEMYFYGRGVDIDYQKSKKFFEEILNDNCDDAYYKLGLIYSGNYEIEKNEEKSNEYFDKIEIDLCIALIFYIFALRPEEEQNTNKIFELLNNEIDAYKIMVKQLPFYHPARLYNNRLSVLEKKEYDDIVERLKYKVEKCIHDKKFSELFRLFEYEDDIKFFAQCIVKSYNYDSISEYIKYLIKKENSDALAFIGKILFNGDFVEKDERKALNYLLKSEKNSLNATNEIVNHYIMKIEESSNPEIQYILGSYYWEKEGFEDDGFKLIQKSAMQNYGQAKEKLSNIIEKISNKYAMENPNDVGYGSIFQLAKESTNHILRLFIINYYTDDEFEKTTSFKFIQSFANQGNEMARNAIDSIMKEIKNNYQVNNKLTSNDLEIIYYYNMNNYEREKIHSLNLDNKIKKLQTDNTLFEYWNNSIKYIEGMGYMYIQLIHYLENSGCSQSGGWDSYSLIVEPTIEINKARRQIKKILDNSIKERKL